MNMTCMVLYMYSITLYLSCLFIKIKENPVLRAKVVNFLIYVTHMKFRGISGISSNISKLGLCDLISTWFGIP